MKKKTAEDRPPRRIRVKKPYSQQVRSSQVIPEEELEKFPGLLESEYAAADDVVDWLQTRWRISRDAIKKYDLRLYLDEATCDGGVVFITRSPAGEAVALHRMMLDESLRLQPIQSRRYGRGDSSNVCPHWFGQFVETGNPKLILTSHPLDVLRLSTLGIRGAVASLGLPSQKQLDCLDAQVVYTAFGAHGPDYVCMPTTLMALRLMKRFSFDWEDAGITYARELDSLAQFKKVYFEKRKWVVTS